MGRFPFLFLSCTVLGAQLWFWPHLCICTTSAYRLYSREGAKAAADWGTLMGGGYSSTTGICLKCLQAREGKQLQQTVATFILTLWEPATACRGRGWQVGVVTAPSFMIHSRIVPCFLQTTLPLGTFPAAEPLTPVSSVVFAQPTVVLSPDLLFQLHTLALRTHQHWQILPKQGYPRLIPEAALGWAVLRSLKPR